MKTLPALLLLCVAAWIVPSATAQSNTIVRFHFYHGTTTVGDVDVDVEMFDHDKPVTVSNFLRYVRSGGFHNLQLSRCLPGFVIQAGSSWSPNPLSTAPALSYPGVNYGPITNEFEVGPRLSNTFGTISMARVGGETNSASGDWFFNLGNNSTNLDNVDGGFTVFGQVISGSNTLDYFNHPSPKLNLLGELPVSNPARSCRDVYNYSDCPRYNELYHVRVSILPIADTKPPTVTITSPAPNAKFTNTDLTVTGKASDDNGVAGLFYSVYSPVYGGDYTTVAAGTNWSFTTYMAGGTNMVYVTSVDGAGQRSASSSRYVFHSVRRAIALTNAGNGMIRGATNGQELEMGKAVTLKAVPAPGHLFAGWSGSYDFGPYAVSQATFSFHMFSNLSATATFVPNPFLQLKGTWSGLFYNPADINQPGGTVTFTVTDLGKVSGKLSVAGRSLPFSSTLSAYGEANIRIAAGSVAALFDTPNFPRATTWYLFFKLDDTNKTDTVYGPNDGGTGYPYLHNPNTNGFTSRLLVHKLRPGTLANPSPYAGKHTLAISGGGTISQPFGMGYGAVTVNTAGTASFAGSLSDGTPFTQSAPVSTNGMWPFYSSLYAGRGWMSGWVGFDYNHPTNDLSGSMRWVKLGPQAGKPYPNGFLLNPTPLIGSRFTNATATTRVLTNLTDGVLSLVGPNLAGSQLTNYVFLATNNTMVNRDPSTNKLTFTLTKPNGLFKGTVRPVGENRTLTYKGVMLPKQGFGAGYYLSTNMSGRVYLGP